MADLLQTSPRERRLLAEWDLLQNLARLNPSRIVALAADGEVFYCTLRRTPALRTGAQTPASAEDIVADHRLKIVFPLYYPSVPLELYVAEPMAHPNIHPRTGFLCLWESHRITHNVEHALHKTVAILAGRLVNYDAVHVMQPDLPSPLVADCLSLVEPLRGIEHPSLVADASPTRKRRLS